MLRTLVLYVRPEEDNQRLDVFLCNRLSRFSRNEIQKRIDGGQVTCPGKSAKASRRVFAGEMIQLTYEVADSPMDNWKPTMPTVLFEDDRVLAVDKTPDLPVHPCGGFGLKSILTALKHGRPNQFFAPAHRLDRETSGVLLFAKDRAADQSLKKAFFEKRCRKEYAALVVGSFPEELNKIEMAIGPTQEGLVRSRWVPRLATQGGYHATTHVKVEQRFESYTRLSLFPETGRQHQLRVHLSAVGHHIVGDKLYGPSESLYLEFAKNRGMTDHILEVLGISRQALHAKVLIFPHPSTGQDILVQSPWPEDLKAFVRKLGGLPVSF